MLSGLPCVFEIRFFATRRQRWRNLGTRGFSMRPIFAIYSYQEIKISGSCHWLVMLRMDFKLHTLFRLQTMQFPGKSCDCQPLLRLWYMIDLLAPPASPNRSSGLCQRGQSSIRRGGLLRHVAFFNIRANGKTPIFCFLSEEYLTKSWDACWNPLCQSFVLIYLPV